jgi:hypothetical protein
MTARVSRISAVLAKDRAQTVTVAYHPDWGRAERIVGQMAAQVTRPVTWPFWPSLLPCASGSCGADAQDNSHIGSRTRERQKHRLAAPVRHEDRSRATGPRTVLAANTEDDKSQLE